MKNLQTIYIFKMAVFKWVYVQLIHVHIRLYPIFLAHKNRNEKLKDSKAKYRLNFNFSNYKNLTVIFTFLINTYTWGVKFHLSPDYSIKGDNKNGWALYFLYQKQISEMFSLVDMRL